MIDDDTVDDAITAMEEARRRIMLDREHDRAIFEDALRTARPSGEAVHNMLIMNFTTKPKVDRATLMLSWMQHYPDAWKGYHPAYCQDVAREFGIGEDV